jgi:hypothetical protein
VYQNQMANAFSASIRRQVRTNRGHALPSGALARGGDYQPWR